MSESPTLRVLVITSRPLVTVQLIRENGQLTSVRHPIALKPVRHVREELERALREMRGPVTVRYLARVTTAAVQTALLDSYNVVHFIGHGAEDGRLLLEQENAVADLLSVERAAQMLRGSQAQLVVISACHSGKAAQALRQAGIANVVAIDEQFPIADHAAALFNQLFYGALVRGRSLSEAFRLGVDAVQADNEVGDHRPPLDEKTGAELPLWSSRFSPFFADDRPLVAEAGPGQYEELNAWTVPTNLPHNPEIVGREVLMVDAIKALAGARLVTLTGPGGIGKTTIAEEVARWHAERELFHDGVFFVSLEGIKDAVRLAETLARALNITPDPANLVASVQAALARREILLLLDNAETLLEEPVEDASSAVGVLGTLLEAAPNLKLLMTSREALGLRRWEQQLMIDEMAQGEAERLFLNYAPAEQRLELALVHRATIQEICRTLEHYPLALVLAAPQLSEAGMTPERLLRDLKAKMLAVLEDEGSRGVPRRLRSLRASLDLSYQRLSGRARIVLFYLGVLPGGASGQILASLVGKRFEPAAQELIERNLARWQDDRYTMLAPIRAYAVATRPSKRLAAVKLRVAKFYTEFARMMDDLLRPVPRRKIVGQLALQQAGQRREELEREFTTIALTTLETERSNLLSAMEWAFALEQWSLVHTLVANLNIYLNLSALWGDMEAAGKMAVTASKQEGNRAAEGIALNNLGVSYSKQGRWAEASTMYERSLAISREVGDRSSEALALNNLGNILRERRLFEESIVALTQSLEMRREIGDRCGEGETLNNLGVTYRLQGRLTEAEAASEGSLIISREVGDRLLEGSALNTLGAIYIDQGRWKEALTALQQSLTIKRELGDRLGEGRTFNNLGVVYDTKGEFDKAISVTQQGRIILLEVGDRLDAALASQHLSSLYRRRSDLDAAFRSSADAFILALELPPTFAADILRDILDIAKENIRTGKIAELTSLGQKLLVTLKQQDKREWKDEASRIIFVVCQMICKVFVLLGELAASPLQRRETIRKQALEIAKKADEGTQGIFGVEKWVKTSCARGQQKQRKKRRG